MKRSVMALLLLVPASFAQASAGCRGSFSKGSLSKISVRSGYHVIQESENRALLTSVIAITSARTLDEAAGKNKIYFTATLPNTAVNRVRLNTLSTQIESGKVANLCVKPKESWVSIDSEFNFRYGVEPNTYIIDAVSFSPI